MKVKVIAEAYYNDSIVKEGDIIDYKKKPLPSWATLLDGAEVKKKQDKKADCHVVEAPDNDECEIVEGDSKVTTESPEAPIDRVEYLNQLISEGIEKDILIEDSDKKTVEEQIKELEKALKK